MVVISRRLYFPKQSAAPDFGEKACIINNVHTMKTFE